MAATYRSSASATTGTSAAATLTIPVPAGVQPNDVLVAVVGTDGGTSMTITAPSGWTGLTAPTQGTNSRLGVYMRVAADTEPANYTWTFSSSFAASGIIAAYSGAHPFTPYQQSSIGTTTPSTTITGVGTNSSYETGLALQCILARNTSAASTITAGNPFTKRADTCSGGSVFINTALTEAPKALPLGGLATANATCSQTATGIMVSVFLGDQRPAFSKLAIDEYSVGSFTTTRTSSTSPFKVNYPNTLLLAFIGLNKDTATVSSITGNSLTWTLVARENTQAGSSEVWRTLCPTPLVAPTFTTTYSTSVVSGNICIIGIVGANLSGTGGSGAIGAVATSTSSAAAPSVSLVTTRANSWVWSIMNEGGGSATNITAGSNQTAVRPSNDTTNSAASWVLRQNALTPTVGTTVTMNVTSPSTFNCNSVAIEILPAVSRSLGSTGVG